MGDIAMTVRGTLLDPRRVINPLRNAVKPVMARSGAYLRGIARRLIRRVSNPSTYSAPGQPPHTHRPPGQRGLKESILFAVEKDRVVIGPAASVIGGIAHTHEFGGTEPEKRYKTRKPNWKLEVGGHGPIAHRRGGWVYAKLRTAGQVARAQRYSVASDFTGAAIAEAMLDGMLLKKARTYPARPFMGPALWIAQSKLPSLWANAVRKSA